VGYQAIDGGDPAGTPAEYDGFESTVFTARQLQQRVDAAVASLAADEAKNGSTLELAEKLSDAIALYAAAGGTDIGGEDALLDAIVAAYTEVVDSLNEDGSFSDTTEDLLDTWADAVLEAQAALDEGAELDDLSGRDD